MVSPSPYDAIRPKGPARFVGYRRRVLPARGPASSAPRFGVAVRGVFGQWPSARPPDGPRPRRAGGYFTLSPRLPITAGKQWIYWVDGDSGPLCRARVAPRAAPKALKNGPLLPRLAVFLGVFGARLASEARKKRNIRRTAERRRCEIPQCEVLTADSPHSNSGRVKNRRGVDTTDAPRLPPVC